MKYALCIAAVSMMGCGNDLGGTWTSATQILAFNGDGYVTMVDNLYPPEALASVDATNTFGYKFRGKFSAADELLSLDGLDGLFARDVVPRIVETDSYRLEGDVLATHLYRSNDLTTMQIPGTWIAQSSISMYPSTGPSSHDETKSVLVFDDAGTVTRTDTTTGGPPSSTAGAGRWHNDAGTVTVTDNAAPTTPGTSLTATYTLIGPGVLATNLYRRMK